MALALVAALQAVAARAEAGRLKLLGIIYEKAR